MKIYILIPLLFLVNNVSAQFFEVDEIIEFDQYHVKSTFPVFKNQQYADAAKRINTYLFYTELTQVFGKSDTSIFSNVFSPEGEFWGQSMFEYAIFRNDGVFLSIAISYDATGAYTENHTDYFTFVSKTGEHVLLEDFFAETPLLSLGEIVNERIANEIMEHMSTIDTELEDGDVQYEMYSECLGYFEGNDELYSSSFYLDDRGMVFVKPRCSNHMMAALDELWEFEELLSYESLENFFNQNGMTSYKNGIWNSKEPATLNDKILTGQIKNKYPITFRLQFSSNYQDISGLYWYDKIKTPIALNGFMNSLGELVLQERVNEKITGTFTGSIKDNVYEGVWKNADGSKQMPFSVSL